jgi:signal transduction histidine kinase
MNDAGSSNPEGVIPSSRWTPSTPEELLQSMFYELRTPLMTIKGYALILADENHRDLHPQAIESILHSTERLETLLNQMAHDYREFRQKPGT